MKNVYLVGFMGTGKTEVSKALAQSLGVPRFDLDHMIEANDGRPITEIFGQSGEPFFRKLEKEALTEASTATSSVVDCGGGVVLDPDNIRLMKETGVIICLSASSEVIVKRTKNTGHRPLLNIPDPKAAVESLLKARESCYRKADVTIDTSKLTIPQVVKAIKEQLADD